MSTSNKMTASDSAAPPFLHGDYRMIQEVGRGSFARVMKARHVKTGNVCAVKMVAKGRLNQKLMANLKTEIAIMRSLKHPGILQLAETYESAGHVNLVMEFARIGDLAKLTRYMKSIQQVPVLHEMQRRYPSQHKNLHPIVVRLFVRQLVDSMKFLSDRNLIHRDIKPQNILLDKCDISTLSGEQLSAMERLTSYVGVSMESWRWLPLVKLADFGFARHLPSTSLAETLCGSPLYMGPEILRYEHYGGKADLWSLGAVVYELIVGRPPYKAKNHIELLKKIETTTVEFPADGHFDKDMVKFVTELLKRNPTERLDFDRTFNHEAMRCPIVGLRPDDYPGSEPLPIDNNAPVPSTARTTEGPPRVATPVVHNTRNTTPEHKRPDISERRRSEVTPRRPSIAHERPPSDPHIISTGSPRRTSSNRATYPAVSNDGFTHTPVTGGRSPESSGLIGAGSRRLSSRDSSRARMTGFGTQVEQMYSASKHGSQPQLHHASSHAEMTRALEDAATPDVFNERPLSSRRESHSRRSKLNNYVTPDSAVDSDYVVIEKKQVEVNAMADAVQMAASPQANARNQLVPRSHSSTAVNIQNKPSHKKRNSIDVSPSHSPHSLARAISGAGKRFFGSAFAGPRGFRNNVSPPLYNPYSGSAPNLTPGLLTDGRTNVDDAPQQETKIAKTIEDYANRSDCIYGFAEIKFQQLMPDFVAPNLPGSNTEQLSEDGASGLTDDAIIILSEEAMLLYVKALDILAHALDFAGSWWNRRSASDFTSTANRISTTVQWLRGRFNETIEKVEIVSTRLAQAQSRVPKDHPAHPSNHADEPTIVIGSRSVPVHISSKITAEKLIYDRALDICKHAASDEICKRNLADCEHYYATALRMIEALYDRYDGDENRAPEEDSQDDEDHIHLVKMAHAIRCRLSNTRTELRAQRDAERGSSQGHRRNGSVTPVSITSN